MKSLVAESSGAFNVHLGNVSESIVAVGDISFLRAAPIIVANLCGVDNKEIQSDIVLTEICFRK